MKKISKILTFSLILTATYASDLSPLLNFPVANQTDNQTQDQKPTSIDEIKPRILDFNITNIKNYLLTSLTKIK